MSGTSRVADVLASLAEFLGERRLRWYLFGAQAVILWGLPRTTLDVDVTVEIPIEDVGALVVQLGDHGFDLRVRTGVEEFVRRARVLPLEHRDSGVRVDMVLAGPGLEQLFLERARSTRIGNAIVPVISPEDLIVTKMLAARPKDIDDVRGVLAERLESLDLATVRSTLQLLEEALGQSDLIPAFERALASVRC